MSTAVGSPVASATSSRIGASCHSRWGGGAHQAVPRADEPGNRDPDADDAAPCECGLLPRSDRVGHESRSLAGSDEFGALDPESGGDRLVEGYRRDRHGIHLGVHGDRDDPGIGGDDR